MGDVSFVSILLGTIIILTRGPMIFAPKGTRDFFLKAFFSSHTRIRVIGLLTVGLGILIIYAAQGNNHPVAVIFEYFGWFVAVIAGLIFLVFTSVFKEIAENVLDNMDELILRIIGIIAVGMGGLFIYLGLYVF